MTNKLSANMTRTLITVAEAGGTIVWGRDKASALALAKRSLIEITNEMESEGSGVGLVVKITDPGFALAVELV